MITLIKGYKCPIYKTVKMKLFKLDGNGNLKDESHVFDGDSQDKIINLYNARNIIFVECRTVKNIETLLNTIV